MRDELQKAHSKARSYVASFMQLQQQVSTLNHYYMSTVNKIRTRLSQHQARSALPYDQQDGGPDPTRCEINDFELDLSMISGSTLQNFNAPANGLSDESNFAQACLDMQINLVAYCKLVQKTLVDDIAKAATQAFVFDALLDQLWLTIDQHLTDAQLEEYMEEEARVKSTRQKLQKEVDAYEKAMKVIHGGRQPDRAAL